MVEIEGASSFRSHGVFRDLIHASLASGVSYLALCVPGAASRMITFKDRPKKQSTNEQPFGNAADWLDAVYATKGLSLPLKGVLLVGY
jgi:hypothetical protein